MVETGKIILVSDTRQPNMLPAQTCIAELNHVIEQQWNAVRGDQVALGADFSCGENDVLLVTALSYRSLLATRDYYKNIMGKTKTSIAIVFDAFCSNRFTKLPKFVQHHSNYGRLLRSFDTVFSPIQGAIEEQRANLGANIKFMAFGIDTHLARGENYAHDDAATAQRPILVNGYGRQPPAISSLLSANINSNGRGIYHHTDHCQIGMVTNAQAHRAHFWALLNASQFALAYAPEFYDPNNRFPCSFVGQRWLEMLAAGCIVLGKRPSAPEAAQMFDWPDATIDLPDDPEAAWERIQKLSGDTGWLNETSARNRALCAERHDWRVRLEQVVKPAMV